MKDIKLDFNKVFLAILFTVMIIFAVSLIPKRGVSYPKIAIERISIEQNKDSGLVNHLLDTNDNIWYYDTYEVEVCNKNLICYSLASALNHKQITLDSLKEYYEKQVKENNIESINHKDNIIYKTITHTVIFCNNESKDIYYGPTDLLDKLNGNYCNHDVSKRKYFTRTYNVLNIIKSDSEYIDLTIGQFQGDTEIIRIPNIYDIEENKTYEFTFYTYKSFDDNLENIFSIATLYGIKETDKVGLDQLQEPITVTSE